MPDFSGKFLVTAIVAVMVAGGGVFYMNRQADASSPAAAAMPPPPQVPVITMQPQSVKIWHDFSGRLQAVDFVELRPQVSGAIREIRFKDGQMVAKGDILFVIDPTPYQAAAAQAAADLQAAKSQQALAIKELGRAANLVKAEAISKHTYDDRQNTATVSKNQVTAAEARVNQTQIDVDRAFVKAPISGRVSRPELTVGNLVQAGGSAPLLTTIASNEGIYADFEVDEQTYLQNVYKLAPDRESQSKIAVELTLKSAPEMIYKGVIQSFDNHIDTASGTIRARAYFDNKDGSLLPGMFVSIRLGSPSTDQSLMITENAIGTDQNRKFVYTVGKDNKVVYNEVKLGASVEGQRVVTDGLKSGDQVIVDGIMKIHPEMVVNPVAPVAPANPADAPPASH